MRCPNANKITSGSARELVVRHYCSIDDDQSDEEELERIRVLFHLPLSFSLSDNVRAVRRSHIVSLIFRRFSSLPFSLYRFVTPSNFRDISRYGSRDNPRSIYLSNCHAFNFASENFARISRKIGTNLSSILHFLSNTRKYIKSRNHSRYIINSLLLRER